jgi:ATP-binding cassette subfamily B protein
MSDQRYNNFAIYRRLLQEARPYWPHLIGLFVINIAASPIALLTPLPIKVAVDSIIGGQPVSGFLAKWIAPDSSRASLIAFCAAFVIVIAVLNHLQIMGSYLLRTYTGEKLVLGFRAKLFRHAQRLSLSYHDSKGTSDSTYRIQYDAPAIEWILIDGISPFISAAFTLGAMVYVSARIDWHLAAVALAIAPVLGILAWANSGRLRRNWDKTYELQSSALSIIQEVLSAVRVVKAFGQEDREQQRFVHRYGETIWARLRIALTQGGFGLLVGLTIAAGTAAVLFIGIHHVESGILTLGGLLIVMTYISQLYGPLETLSSMTAQIQGSLSSAARALFILDQTPEVVERPNPIPLSRCRGTVTFDQVCFGYPESEDSVVLRNACFEITPNTRVGITGVTGSGKSTLVNLLTRFYDPTSGRILLDGIDLRDYKLADLRDQFAIVLQEPVLFSTTIAENIAYARPDASEDEIVQAAKRANAHEFIMRMPDGYQTRVGERGMRLSGGERQRISLARAFLKDTAILILDEPTSALDIKTEMEIAQAIQMLMRGRTVFVIAHRPSLLRTCDVLLIVQNGQPVAVTTAVTAATEALASGESGIKLTDSCSAVSAG